MEGLLDRDFYLAEKTHSICIDDGGDVARLLLGIFERLINFSNRKDMDNHAQYYHFSGLCALICETIIRLVLGATVTSHAPPHAIDIMESGAKQLWRKDYFEESIYRGEELLVETSKQILKELKIPKDKVLKLLNELYANQSN